MHICRKSEGNPQPERAPNRPEGWRLSARSDRLANGLTGPAKLVEALRESAGPLVYALGPPVLGAPGGGGVRENGDAHEVGIIG